MMDSLLFTNNISKPQNEIIALDIEKNNDIPIHGTLSYMRQLESSGFSEINDEADYYSWRLGKILNLDIPKRPQYKELIKYHLPLSLIKLEIQDTNLILYPTLNSVDSWVGEAECAHCNSPKIDSNMLEKSEEVQLVHNAGGHMLLQRLPLALKVNDQVVNFDAHVAKELSLFPFGLVNFNGVLGLGDSDKNIANILYQANILKRPTIEWNGERITLGKPLTSLHYRLPYQLSETGQYMIGGYTLDSDSQFIGSEEFNTAECANISLTLPLADTVLEIPSHNLEEYDEYGNCYSLLQYQTKPILGRPFFRTYEVTIDLQKKEIGLRSLIPESKHGSSVTDFPSWGIVGVLPLAIFLFMF